MESENPIFRKLVEKMPGAYDVESHVVTTEDGFLLKVFRVRAKGDNQRRPAILL